MMRTTTRDESVQRGFEVSDASVRAVVIAAIVVVLGTIAAMLVVRVMTAGPQNTPAAFGNVGRAGSFTHGPNEETSIQQSWDALEQDLAQTTGSYAWVDRANGIVRIPIERAMQLIVEENGKRRDQP